MNYLDYRKELGIGFNDEKKAEMLKARIITFFDSLHDIPDLKSNFDEDRLRIYYISVGESLNGTYFTWHNLALSITNEETISSMICRYSILINKLEVMLGPSFLGLMPYKKYIEDFLYESLNELNIKYTIKPDEDGAFIFPEGAKELDNSLVSEPLEWLRDYPKSHSTFIRALKQYSEGQYIRDVADNFRKALEEFLQEFLDNEKNLDNNRNEVCSILKANGADKSITNMLQPLLNYYNNLNDTQVKHNDKLDPKLLEFIMYQTGLFIRMIITVGKNK